MHTNNLTGPQDRLLSNFAESPNPSEVIEIIEWLDNALTEANERIKELEIELKEVGERHQ